jgi:hypothetical protein
MVERMAAMKESLCTKRARQHGDVPEHALSRLIQNIRHFIFQILCRDKGIDQVLSVRDLQGHDLAACAAEV